MVNTAGEKTAIILYNRDRLIYTAHGTQVNDSDENETYYAVRVPVVYPSDVIGEHPRVQWEVVMMNSDQLHELTLRLNTLREYMEGMNRLFSIVMLKPE